MLFSSPTFIFLFLPLFFIAYFAISAKWKNHIALAGSLFFYAWGAPKFVLLVLVSGIADFYVHKQFGKNSAKTFLAAGIIQNLLMLLVFKYFNFFLENATVVAAQIGFHFPSYMSIALPLGVSFLTFQKISFLVDTYRDEKLRTDGVVHYLLYIFLFPQLIAGPILRFKLMKEQLIKPRLISSLNAPLMGFHRFVIGLAKKILIADSISPLVDLAFASNNPGFAFAWIGIFAFAFQIYFDFSGYSDMAIGLGKMLGFHFPENFYWPYTAEGFRDFWKRWHITLSQWMRDYVYIPLGGNKLGKHRTALNLWLVFLISGLWHGANWTFMVWGLWHGLFIQLDRTTKIFKSNVPLFNMLLTFLLTTLSWVWFRAANLAQAMHYFESLFTFNSGEENPITNKQWVVLILAAIFSFLPPGSFKIFRLEQDHYMIQKSILIIFVMMLCIGQMATNSSVPFIYFKF